MEMRLERIRRDSSITLIVEKQTIKRDSINVTEKYNRKRNNKKVSYLGGVTIPEC